MFSSHNPKFLDLKEQTHVKTYYFNDACDIDNRLIYILPQEKKSIENLFDLVAYTTLH